jgi:hypothetical protein
LEKKEEDLKEKVFLLSRGKADGEEELDPRAIT